MEIKKSVEGDKLTVKIIGRLDSNTSPDLENGAKADVEAAKEIFLDFSELEYVSSAGLRVILTFQKLATAHGAKMTIQHVNDDVMAVFDMTGFSSYLTIVD